MEVVWAELAPRCVMVCFVPRERKQVGRVEHFDAVWLYGANAIDMSLIEP
jgi:hypothetical protein